MAWKTLVAKLRGDASLIMHNGQTADPLNTFSKKMKRYTDKRAKKTEADNQKIAEIEFSASLYMSEDGPVIPAEVIEAVIVGGAKKFSKGPLAKSGVYCPQDARLEYEGPRTTAGLWKDERFHFKRNVRVRQSRVPRMRPIFEEWEVVITLKVDDEIVNPDMVKDWLCAAGTQVGIGDWRPKHGRFVVVEWFEE